MGRCTGHRLVPMFSIFDFFPLLHRILNLDPYENMTTPETAHLGPFCRSSILSVAEECSPDPVALVDLFEDFFGHRGDELASVRVRNEDAVERLKPADARSKLGSNPAFTFLEFIPRSEGRRARAKWQTKAEIGFALPHRKTFFFGRPYDDGADEWSSDVELWKGLAKLVEPTYGFGLDMPFLLGPDYLADGIRFNGNLGGDMPEIGELVGKWSDETQHDPKEARSGRHTKGCVLDIFPLNLLTSVHLQQPLGVRTVGDWIRTVSAADKVIQLAHGAIAWLPTPDVISKAKVEFSRNGLIIPSRGRDFVH